MLTIIVGHMHSCIHTKALKYHTMHFKQIASNYTVCIIYFLLYGHNTQSVSVYLPDQVLVLYESQISACSLCNSFPSNQITQHDGGRANTDYERHIDRKEHFEKNIICIGFSPLDFRVPSPLRSLFNPCIHTWLFLTWFWHVGDAGVGAHEDVAGVQRSLQEELLGVGDVNTP